MDISTILTIIASIAAVFAAGYAIKIVISPRKSSKTDVKFTSQKNNTAGGDIVAGNSIKTNTK